MSNKTRKSKITNKALEKEIIILKKAIDDQAQKKRNIVQNVTIQKIFKILETFLKNKKLVCYGGTAINNILPIKQRFYDTNIELPDYDFFTPNAIDDAIELANLFYKNGFDEVEAKSGVHTGTYKIYVNFIPIADITQLDQILFNNIQKNAIIKKGIYYAPPNYLRMAAYLELSRPDGDISRWEKVWKRLSLLNKNYPITKNHCNISDFVNYFETPIKDLDIINKTIIDSIIKLKLVFFGGYAVYQYSKYMSMKHRKLLLKHPNFDILAIDPLESINVIKHNLISNNIKNIEIKYHNAIGEIIPEHYELIIDDNSLLYIYKTIACHSYNTIKINNKKLNIASIETMLSLYLAFLYADKEYYDTNRILCICQYLFILQIKNRFKQKGLLKRFTTKCYGKQETIEDIRAHKAFIYNRLKKKPCNKEYRQFFLRYIPAEGDKCLKKKTIKKKKN